MQMRFKNKQTGVTLFEVLLVLMIMIMIIFAGIRMTKQKRDDSVAALFAQKLYEYGVGVNNWANVNRLDIRAAGCTEGSTVEPCYYTGIQWLLDAGNDENGNPFLESDFTFDEGLTPLIVQNIAGAEGNATVETRIWLQDPNDKTASPIKMKISLGSLYDPSAPDQSKDVKGEVLPEITAEAGAIASRTMDGRRGISPFVFDVDLTTGNFELVGLSRDTTGTTEKYLRTDGANYMKGDLVFVDQDAHGYTTDPEGYAIRYLENIEFDNDVNTTVSNLDTLSFDPTVTNTQIIKIRKLNFKSNVNSTINQVRTLNFRNTTASKITNLKNMNFQSNGSVDFSQGVIENANKISFGSNSSIIDLKNMNMKAGIIEKLGELQWLRGQKTVTVTYKQQCFYLFSKKICTTVPVLSTAASPMKMNDFFYVSCMLQGGSVGSHIFPMLSDSKGGACFTMTNGAKAACQIVQKGDIVAGMGNDGDSGKCGFGCVVWDKSAVFSPLFCQPVYKKSDGYAELGYIKP